MGTLQWNVHSPHSWSSPSPSPTIAHYNGTLQWHPAMAPRPLPQSWSSPSPPTIAHYNGTPLKLVVTLPPNHSTLQWQPTMAPAWCHVQSTKVVRRPPPFLEVRTPIAIAIWGKNTSKTLLGLGISEASTGVLSPHVTTEASLWMLRHVQWDFAAFTLSCQVRFYWAIFLKVIFWSRVFFSENWGNSSKFVEVEVEVFSKICPLICCGFFYPKFLGHSFRLGFC